MAALASMFGNKRVVTEVAANAKSALAAGGRANPAAGAAADGKAPAKSVISGLFAHI